jgi:hypothetical protein
MQHKPPTERRLSKIAQFNWSQQNAMPDAGWFAWLEKQIA